ncbi:MAG: nitroreductase family protein [Chloroflexota bacterium]|nr:nitroreductase family protein [Chloroflexota bacterium]
MNETLRLIQQRRSVRAYEDRPIERETVDTIINAAMRAPTAGNLMLYSILEIEDPAIKAKLAQSCDNQPFIARAPLVLVFLADYQRWIDAFVAADVPAYCRARGETMRLPGEGDLLLACCDALIAAQTAVIAAESLGVGSCYIGDIMERYEVHRELLGLPPYAFPVTMVCFGYPTPASRERALTTRFPQASVHFKDRYRRLDEEELFAMLETRARWRGMEGALDAGQRTYLRKFAADFTVEMSRSVREAIRTWTADQERESEDSVS